MKDKAFLGKGWSFPPKIEGGLTEIVTAEEDIKQSLEILLSTLPGERIMRPLYGCNLERMMFESLSTTFITYMRDMIETAILYHEPRIDLKKVDVFTGNVNQGRIEILVEYVIRTTNSRINFVYPYYINEATDL